MVANSICPNAQHAVKGDEDCEEVCYLKHTFCRAVKSISISVSYLGCINLATYIVNQSWMYQKAKVEKVEQHACVIPR